MIYRSVHLACGVQSIPCVFDGHGCKWNTLRLVYRIILLPGYHPCHIRERHLRAVGLAGQGVKQAAKTSVQSDIIRYHSAAALLHAVQLYIAGRKNDTGGAEQLERSSHQGIQALRRNPRRILVVSENFCIRSRCRQADLLTERVSNGSRIARFVPRPIHQDERSIIEVGPLAIYVEFHAFHFLSNFSATWTARVYLLIFAPFVRYC